MNVRKTRTSARLNAARTCIGAVTQQDATAPVSIRELYVGDAAGWLITQMKTVRKKF